ncbi:hypothetical protein [Cellulomonas phragmiteti]|nr:hypothetical protein [Cellulomonas phragmiteti]
MTDASPAPRRETRLHALARGVAIVAALLALADVVRWANRWYVSTMLADTPDGGLPLVAAAHSALVGAVAWSLVAVAAAFVGWRFRIVAAP